MGPEHLNRGGYQSLIYPVGILTAAMFVAANGHVSNAAFFLLFLFCLTKLNQLSWIKDDSQIIFLFLAPVAAVAIGQILRADLSLKEFDSPVRLLAALAIYGVATRCIKSKRKLFMSLAMGAAIGLTILPFFFDSNWIAHYGGRFATSKSAPNDLGGYSGLLLIITTVALLSSVTEKRRGLANQSSMVIVIIMLIGMGAGTYVLLGTLSRGPYIVVMACLLLVLFWYSEKDSKRTSLVGLSLLIFFTVITQTTWFDKHRDRLWSTILEPLSSLDSREKSTSSGVRLAMLEASVEMALKRPLTGYGDFGYSPIATEPKFLAKYGAVVSEQLGGQGGPHNEIAARSLQSGVWGLIATVFLLVYPVYRFGRQTLQAQDDDQRDLSFMGFVIFSYIFLLSFVLEPYSLKHTATFNALLLAVLLGATRIEQTAIAAPEKSNA